MNLKRRLFPVVFAAYAASTALPVAVVSTMSAMSGCSDEDCTSGTVRVSATVPPEVVAGVTAVDVSFEIGGNVIHTHRLPLAAGATQVESDITLPGPYPAGQRVVVTAVAKRPVGAGQEVAVATWFAVQEFPAGCVGFVFTLFPGSTMDGGTSEGGVLFPDGGAFEAGVDGNGNTADGSAGDGSAGDGVAGDAGGDASVDSATDAPVI